MLYIMLANLMLFAALSNAVCITLFLFFAIDFCKYLFFMFCFGLLTHSLFISSINQSIKLISNQIKKFDIQCTLYNIHGKLFYNKHVATFSISD